MVDYEAVTRVKLNDEAFDHAITAAGASAEAGDDDQGQLKFALQTYLYLISHGGTFLPNVELEPPEA